MIVNKVQSSAAKRQIIHTARKTGGFSSRLAEQNFAERERYIYQLRDKIFLQGEVIKKKADYREFQEYRRLISEFIGEAVTAYTLSSGSRGRQRMYTVIKTVNKKLDEIAIEVLNEQADNIRIVSLVEDIRGLIVDLSL